jgi:serine/threonine-protein kinase
VVLRVTHLQFGEELAIKILSPEAGGGPEVHARFLREAQSAVRLRGEHVARVGDVGVLPGGAPYMVMECLRGGDLSGELARRRALPPGEVVDYLLQACEALAEAHALGIVHRDIKPSNLFLTRRPDGSPLVKVLDFGISKAPIGAPGVLTRTDTVMGTPGYMSPEQMKASKDVDARSDIWALGIVLYECLNGRRPFDAETFSATVLRAATEPPPPMDPRLPRGLQAVILQCLEKDRGARFSSIAALAVALAPFARDARSAGIIVERTTAMLRRPGASVAQTARFGQLRDATTLSGSAGMMRVRSTRRYAIGGVAVVLAAIVAFSVVELTAPRESRDTARPVGSGTVAMPPALATNGSSTSNPAAAVTVDAGSAPDATQMAVTVDASSAPDATKVAVTVDAGSVPDATRVAVMVDAAVMPTMPQTAAEAPARSNFVVVDAKAKTRACVEFEVNQKWQELQDCARELAVISVHDQSAATKAEEFFAKAVGETSHSLASGKLKEAIAKGNLREAQIQLKSIGADSVYFVVDSEAFHMAEARAVDDNRRKAEALVTSNDCTGVHRLQALVNTTSTAAVADAVAAEAAKCVDRRSSQSSAQAVASAGSDHAHAAATNPCDTMNVDDMVAQSRNQYVSGFPKLALKLLTKALSCNQDVEMYRMGGLYACAAHDAQAARQFYSKAPAEYQIGIAQRCRQEGIIVP